MSRSEAKRKDRSPNKRARGRSPGRSSPLNPRDPLGLTTGPKDSPQNYGGYGSDDDYGGGGASPQVWASAPPE